MNEQFLAEFRNTPVDQLIDAFALYILNNSGSGGSEGAKGDPGDTGPAGASAYQTWLQQAGNAGRTEAEFLASVKGSDGQSAYDLWRLAGGVGTPTDFINSLGTQTGLAISSIRGLTAPATGSPKIISLTDTYKQGLFQVDPSDTTTADDGALTLVTTSGVRYKRIMPDARITPQMFGAVGNGTADDTVAMQAWLNVSGNVTHQLPRGKYRITTAISRINKGAINLIGDGYSSTEILVDGDISGVIITNGANESTWGTFNLSGYTVRSISAKTGGVGHRITTQHLQRPGSGIRNISVMCHTEGQEWAAGLHMLDCSRTNLDDIYIEGANRNVFTGILIEASANSPSVQVNLTNFNVTIARIGIHVKCNGYPGVEGIQISNGTLDSCRTGLFADSPTYGAPYLGVKGIHMNVNGGPAINSIGFQQIKIEGCLLYVNNDPLNGNEEPVQGVLINNGLTITGDFVVFMRGTATNAVEFTGTGGLINLDIIAAVANLAANAVTIPSTYESIRMAVTRIVTTAGTSTGTDIAGTGASKVERKMAFTRDAAVVGDLIQYQTSGAWKSVNTIKAITDKNLYTPASVTVDPSLYNDIYVDNGGTPVTITIDSSTATLGQHLKIRQSGGSTGLVTVTTLVPAGNKMEDEAGSLNNTYVLSKTGPARRVIFAWTGAHWHLHVGTKGVLVGDVSGNLVLTGSLTATGATINGNGTLNGDFAVPAVNGRQFGFTGLNTGMTIKHLLGDATTSRINVVFGQPWDITTYHGAIINNISGSNSPALTVNGNASGQAILTLFKSTSAIVGSYEQDGRHKYIHSDATLSGTPTATTAVALGTGGTITVRAGDGDEAHQLTIVVGSSGITNNQIAQVAFAGLPYTRSPIVTFSNVYNMPPTLAINSSSTTGYTIHPGTTLTAGYTFVINVRVSQ